MTRCLGDDFTPSYFPATERIVCDTLKFQRSKFDDRAEWTTAADTKLSRDLRPRSPRGSIVRILRQLIPSARRKTQPSLLPRCLDLHSGVGLASTQESRLVLVALAW